MSITGKHAPPTMPISLNRAKYTKCTVRGLESLFMAWLDISLETATFLEKKKDKEIPGLKICTL